MNDANIQTLEELRDWLRSMDRCYETIGDVYLWQYADALTAALAVLRGREDARNEALEQAAKVADDMYWPPMLSEPAARRYASVCEFAAGKIAEAIRHLGGSPSPRQADEGTVERIERALNELPHNSTNRDKARAAIAALSGKVPEGWRLVPTELTDAMHSAGFAVLYDAPRNQNLSHTVRVIYDAFLTYASLPSAPEPPAVSALASPSPRAQAMLACVHALREIEEFTREAPDLIDPLSHVHGTALNALRAYSANHEEDSG